MYYIKGILLLSLIFSMFFSGLLTMLLAIFTNLNIDDYCIRLLMTMLTVSILVDTACVLMYNVNPTLWLTVTNIKSAKQKEHNLYTMFIALIPDIKLIHDIVLDMGRVKKLKN